MKSLTLGFFAIATFLLAAMVYVLVTNVVTGISDEADRAYRLITLVAQWAMIAGPLAFVGAAVAIAGGEERRDQQSIAIAVLILLAGFVLVVANNG